VSANPKSHYFTTLGPAASRDYHPVLSKDLELHKLCLSFESILQWVVDEEPIFQFINRIKNSPVTTWKSMETSDAEKITSTSPVFLPFHWGKVKTKIVIGLLRMELLSTCP
jgi:hypothetical protein